MLAVTQTSDTDEATSPAPGPQQSSGSPANPEGWCCTAWPHCEHIDALVRTCELLIAEKHARSIHACRTHCTEKGGKAECTIPWCQR